MTLSQEGHLFVEILQIFLKDTLDLQKTLCKVQTYLFPYYTNTLS